MSQLFTSGGQSIGASASTSVLSINIQDWFPLEESSPTPQFKFFGAHSSTVQSLSHVQLFATP